MVCAIRTVGGNDEDAHGVEAKSTVRGHEEPHTDEGCFVATATIQGVRMVLSRCADTRDKVYEAFVGDYTQALFNAEVRDGEQLFPQVIEGRTPNAGKSTSRAS